jgi:hypothetical protein
MNGQCHFAEYKEGWNLLVSRVLPLPSGFSNVALRISKSYQYFLYRPSEAGNENYCYSVRHSCQKWSQICHKTSRRCLNRAHTELASLCDILIFLGILVRVTFLTNIWIVSDQNLKYCFKLYARVVSDLSYDFKKMLESCSQELQDGLPIPVFRGILMRVEFLRTDSSWPLAPMKKLFDVAKLEDARSC